jgi:ubiquinol-cytochrome c reductase cytochrome c subunit
MTGMTARAEARVLSRILRIGLLLAVVGQIGWSLRPEPSRAQSDQQREGEALYQASCSTCHGLGAQGTDDGPSLEGAGAAALDFYLSTGRMPLANPEAQPQRSSPKFSRQEIDAIIAYVGTLVPGGEPIPSVDPQAGSLARGLDVFLASCAACHGAGATGDSIGGGQIAPSLSAPDAREIGEAIRIGPGQMPRFGPETLSQEDVDSLARYLLWMRDHGDEGGVALGRVGPVAEGLIAVVIGLGLLVLVIRLTGSRV